MRDGLAAPRPELPPENLGRIRAFLEGQSRLKLAIRVRHPTWIDLYPVSEAEALRSFGTVLWEQTTPEDPLDYRFTFEPFEPETDAVGRFSALVAELPGVRRVGAEVAPLRKGSEEVESRVRLAAEAPPESEPLRRVTEAARDSVFAGRTAYDASLEPPRETMTILCEARA
jgi:hypothetical protein